MGRAPFAEAKDWHGLRRFRLRWLWRVNCEALLVAAGQNLKLWLVKTGWGRRHGPGGSLTLAYSLLTRVIWGGIPCWLGAQPARLFQRAAVARLYEQASGIGEIRRNVFLPDRVTGQARQIDVLLDVAARGHTVRILIDEGSSIC